MYTLGLSAYYHDSAAALLKDGEYKVMGLAPCGEQKYAQTIFDHLIDLKPDGSYRLDQSCFDYCTGVTITNAKFDALFGTPPRKPDEPLTQREMDLAASLRPSPKKPCSG